MALRNVRHTDRLRVVGLGVEGRSADRDPVVLDQHHVQAHRVGDELGYEAVLYIAGHLQITNVLLYNLENFSEYDISTNKSYILISQI